MSRTIVHAFTMHKWNLVVNCYWVMIMLKLVLDKQKETKNLWLLAGIFLFVYGLYFFLDWLAHGSFEALFAAMDTPLFITHQFFNIMMALLAALMLSLSQIKLRLANTEPAGSTSIPFLSFILGLLTFGCAPCVIAFFAAVGITFTPIVFPMANLPWKFLLLGLMLIGFVFIVRSIDKGVCKPKSLAK